MRDFSKRKLSPFRLGGFFHKKEALKEAIAKATVLGTLSKISGYLKLFCIAVFIGLNRDTDAYFIVFSLMGIFMTFVDVFDSVGVPNLVRAAKISDEEFDRLAANLFGLTLALTLLLSVAAVIAAPIIPYVAAGFAASQRAEVRLLFFLLIPNLIFNLLFSHFGAVLRSQRQFTSFYVGQLISSAGCTAMLFISLPFLHAVWIIPVATSMGQLLATIFLAVIARRYFRVILEWNDAVKSMFHQFLYLSSLYGVGFVGAAIDNVFASYLPPKMLSALNYGRTFAFLPVSVAPLTTIFITPLSETEGNIGKVKKYLGFMILFSLPFILGCWLLAAPALKFMLEYGRFTAVDLQITVLATKYYVLSLPFLLCWSIFDRSYQVKQSFAAPLVACTLSLVLNTLLKYFLIFKFHIYIGGITLSTLFGYFVLCAVAYLHMGKIAREESSRMKGETASI